MTSLTSDYSSITDKPDIVVILAEEFGNADLGKRGSDVKTPNLDALAETVVRTGEFDGVPVGTLSRASLITRRYPMRLELAA